VAAALGAALLSSLYAMLVMGQRRPTQSDRLLLTLLGWVGALIAFVVTFSLMNVGRAVVEGTLPSNTLLFSWLGVDVYTYVAEGMLIGAVLGALTGGLVGTRANFPIGSVLYTTTRTILNALRSIEPLIMGLVFVIWVGIGPFAGVLALALHSIASLGKLYSEQIENIDSGPLEALQSTGANRLQTIMYAVVPQIIPPYIAFTMYRWDINVRMSTIIGFVGGGGIGFLLQQQINLLRYRDAGVAVLAIAIVVSILDYASAAIRERYT
jgi:phosphonate ABC transporter permease subunit PhnE